MTQINEWYEALDFAPTRKWLENLQRVSHWFRSLVPASFTVAAVVGLSEALSGTDWIISNSGLIVALSYVTAAAIIAWVVGRFIGRTIEQAIDQVQPISYLLLNRGDERIKNKWSKSNLLSAAIAVIGISATIAINVASSWLFERLSATL